MTTHLHTVKTDSDTAFLAEQLYRILDDEEETCRQLLECAQEQRVALRSGDGPGFVRASLTQAHLARRLLFLEEERTKAIETLAQALTETASPGNLLTLMKSLPETDAGRLADRTKRLQTSLRQASHANQVNAQMIQTNIQLAAALTRGLTRPGEKYYLPSAKLEALPAQTLDERV